MVVIGAPGSGKTLLLRSICGWHAVEGAKVVSVNFGFVPADTLNLTPTLTVHETLECSSEAEEILRPLGMDEKLSDVVGTLSGGERKRLLVAMALLKRPKVLLVDEAMTGLDSVSCIKLIETFRSYARENSALVIATAPQLSMSSCREFDSVMLLSQGRCLFHGAPSLLKPHLLDHFGPIAHGSRHTDFADVVSAFVRAPSLVFPECPSIESIADAWQEESKHQTLLSASPPTTEPIPREVPPFQFWDIPSKYMSDSLRRWKELVVVFVLAALVSLFGGLLFLDRVSETADEGPQAVAGLAQFVVIQVVMNNVTLTISMGSQRIALARDVRASPFPRALCHSAMITGLQTLNAIFVNLVRSGVLYFMAGMDTTRWPLYFVLITLLDISTASLHRSLALIIPYASMAQVAAASINGMFILTGSYFVTRDSMPPHLRFLLDVSPFSWAWRALVRNEFAADRYSEAVAPPFVTESRRAVYLDLLGLRGPEHFDEVWVALGVLSGIWVVFAFVVTPIALLLVDDYVRGSRRYSDQRTEDTTEARDVPISRNHSLCVSNIMVHAKDKTLLSDVAFQVDAGQLVAVIGASGSGKSTLLDTIVNRPQSGVKVTERRIEVSADGEIRSEQSDLFISYVMQRDNLYPTQTVSECVSTSCLLATGQDSNVHDILAIVGIQHLSDVRIDLLSPGERRQVSLASHLAVRRPILLADEPTTGLDALAAKKVVDALRSAAKAGFAVCVTIHQPSSLLFQSFDSVLVLDQGKRVFFGPTSTESFLGLPIPENENPAHFMLQHTSHFMSGLPPREPKDAHFELVPETSTATLQPPPPLLFRISIVLARAWMDIVRDRVTLLVRVCASCGVSVAFMIVYSGLANRIDDVGGLISFLGAIGGLGGFLGVMTFGTVTPFLQARRGAVEEETDLKRYPAAVHVLATLSADLIVCAMCVVVTFIPWVYVAEFDTAYVAPPFLSVVLVVFWYSAYAHFFTYVTPDVDQAYNLFSIIVGVGNLFAGFFLPFEDWPEYVRFLAECLPTALNVRVAPLYFFRGNKTYKTIEGQRRKISDWAIDFSLTSHPEPLLAQNTAVVVAVIIAAILSATYCRYRSKW